MPQVELSSEELSIIENRRQQAKNRLKKLSKQVQLRNCLAALYEALRFAEGDNNPEILADAKRVLLLTSPKKRAKRVEKVCVAPVAPVCQELEQENIPA